MGNIHPSAHLNPHACCFAPHLAPRPTVEPSIVEQCYNACDDAGGLIVAGSSLTVYSSFRFVRYMAEKQGKPVLVLNVGPTRSDGMERVTKMELGCSQIFTALAEEYST